MIHPDNSDMMKFMCIRGIIPIDENPNILHYFGSKAKEVERLSDGLDLVVIHRKLDRLPHEVNFAVDLCVSYDEFFRTRTVLTNNVKLTQLYYRRLSLDREFEEFSKPEAGKPRLSGIIERLKGFMFWG